MKTYEDAAVEKAMKIQEVILRAIDKQITWVQAAEIIGGEPTTAEAMASWMGEVRVRRAL